MTQEDRAQRACRVTLGTATSPPTRSSGFRYGFPATFLRSHSLRTVVPRNSNLTLLSGETQRCGSSLLSAGQTFSPLLESGVSHFCSCSCLNVRVLQSAEYQTGTQDIFWNEWSSERRHKKEKLKAEGRKREKNRGCQPQTEKAEVRRGSGPRELAFAARP